MIGTVFASPRGEINEMKIHIGGLTRTTLLRSTPCGERMHLRKREAYHGKANFRHFFRHSFEPLFADPALSFSEKVSRWLALPNTPLKLLSNLLLLAALAVGVAGLQ